MRFVARDVTNGVKANVGDTFVVLGAKKLFVWRHVCVVPQCIVASGAANVGGVVRNLNLMSIQLRGLFCAQVPVKEVEILLR